MELGTYLKNIRYNKGLSLGNVYDETGITDSRLSKIENGKMIPKINDLFTLLNCYEISITEAFQTLGYVKLPTKELRNLHLLSNAEIDHLQDEIDFMIGHRNEVTKYE